MLFSSVTFIYYFLPILLITYFITPRKFRNFVLFSFSILFYFYGEPKYIIVLLISCIVNYFVGRMIDKDEKNKKIYLTIAILYNVLQLVYFKYTDFFIENINQAFNISIPLLRVIMPIGISFFTFQTLSYVIDVYNKKVKSSKSLLNFATYVSLFPQLVAGPIVRYETIENELRTRKETISDFSAGIKLFIIGLGKKVLIANVIGAMCASLGELEVASVVGSWLNAIGFTLQIYFDFSGYSDMAIGLGLMMGFHFLKNFNYPLIASSITDFWRRWHMSLSSFFKDYIYIPLGGSKTTRIKTYRNILIVWMLTGFWHGAAWNFIFWGLYFAIVLIIEKTLLNKFITNSKYLKYIYTSLIIIISFVIFNTTSMSDLLNTFKDMFFISDIPFITNETIYYLNSYFIIIIIAIIGATPLLKNLMNKIKDYKIYQCIEPIYYLLLLLIITAYLVDSSFNPFLYFRF